MSLFFEGIFDEGDLRDYEEGKKAWDGYAYLNVGPITQQISRTSQE